MQSSLFSSSAVASLPVFRYSSHCASILFFNSMRSAAAPPFFFLFFSMISSPEGPFWIFLAMRSYLIFFYSSVSGSRKHLTLGKTTSLTVFGDKNGTISFYSVISFLLISCKSFLKGASSRLNLVFLYYSIYYITESLICVKDVFLTSLFYPAYLRLLTDSIV